MSKKLIATLLFLAVVLGVFAFYMFFAVSDEETGGTTIADFFPFGRGGDVSFEERQEEDTDGIGSTEDANGASAEGPVLQQITDAPVAGAVFVEGEPSSVRYIERRTGHIYEVTLPSFEKARLTNTTIPAVREAFWQSDGEALVIRYLNQNDIIKTFAAVLSPSTEGDTPFQVQGSFIEDDVQFIASSPRGERMFYLFPFEGNTIGIISDFDGTNRDEVFNSLFSEWLPNWPANNTIALTTKAASTADGHLYFLGVRNGSLNKVIGDIPGLTANISPDLNFILYSESAGGLFRTRVYRRDENIQYELPITTLPEKCVWSGSEENTVYCGVPSAVPAAAYPDQWYQGIVSFSDAIWKVDIGTRVAEQVLDPAAVARTEFDIINPAISDDGGLLLFTNKKDSALWSLTLEKN